MWGIGLEHEVRLGFSKNIKPNLYLLVEYLKVLNVKYNCQRIIIIPFS